MLFQCTHSPLLDAEQFVRVKFLSSAKDPASIRPDAIPVKPNEDASNDPKIPVRALKYVPLTELSI
jgi:hypothetical protein